MTVCRRYSTVQTPSDKKTGALGAGWSIQAVTGNAGDRTSQITRTRR